MSQLPYGVARATDPRVGNTVAVATNDPIFGDFYTLNDGPRQEIPADVVKLALDLNRRSPVSFIAMELLRWHRRLMEPAEQEELTLP